MGRTTNHVQPERNRKLAPGNRQNFEGRTKNRKRITRRNNTPQNRTENIMRQGVRQIAAVENAGQNGCLMNAGACAPGVGPRTNYLLSQRGRQGPGESPKTLEKSEIDLASLIRKELLKAPENSGGVIIRMNYRQQLCHRERAGTYIFEKGTLATRGAPQYGRLLTFAVRRKANQTDHMFYGERDATKNKAIGVNGDAVVWS